MNFKSRISNLNFLNKSRYTSLFILLIILLLGGFLRFYKIREYMTFLGDEGRDMLIVKRMIVDHKFTLLGPITSVGSMYMGPIYYYFMVPFLWLWNLDPVGPSIMVAIISVFTIVLMYKVGAEFFNEWIGLLSAFIYAISRLAIIYGRSSWNPNIVPFFALLIIYCLLKVIVKKQYYWLILAGVSLGVLLQLHYTTLMFIPIIICSLALIRFRVPSKYYFGSILGFLFLYSPFLLFEIRHNFVNLQNVWKFIWQQKRSEPPTVFSTFYIIWDSLIRIFWRLVVIASAELTKIFLLLVAIMILFWSKKEKNKEKILALKIIMIWTIIGIVSYGFYHGIIYDYYYVSLFPVPILLSSIALYSLFNINKLGKTVTVFILFIIIFFNIKNNPLMIEPNNMLKNTEIISRFIYDKVGDKPYNFALIATHNSDHAYRYFLEIWGNPPITIENPNIDPERKTVTEQLFVVCEEKICQPLGHSLWEIAGFGRAEITDEWSVVTTKVFRLKHYQD